MNDKEPSYQQSDVWLRTCEEEIHEPLEGKVTGEIPSWLRGTLIRNGPGTNRIGETRLNHVFDGPALLHRFAIQDGKVTYNCRFLNSNTYKKNRATNRLVVSEFGTLAVPDPCKTIFERFSSLFHPMENISDNASISVYPFGDEMYVFSEAPYDYLHRIDPVTLETLEQKQLIHTLLVHHTSHPHVMPNGDVYNVGIYYMNGKIQHAIVKFPFTEKGDMFKSAQIVGTFDPRWLLHPAYMHSFGVTENYFVLIEHPMSISIIDCMICQIAKRQHRSMIKGFPEYETQIVLVHRETGAVKRYQTDTLFYIHTINCYEDNGMLILDLCTYKDANSIDVMYVEVLENPTNLKFKALSYTRPKRLEIPLDAPESTKIQSRLLADVGCEMPTINYKQRNVRGPEWPSRTCSNIYYCRPKRLEIPLDAPESTKIQSRLLADVGCEMPTINYKQRNGKPYKYFYGTVLDLNSKFQGAIVKVNVKSGEVTTWRESDFCPSEAVFVQRPDAKEEDDGVLLSVLLHGKDENIVQLLILDAASLKEIARASFRTPSSVPKCFHGWFLNQNVGLG